MGEKFTIKDFNERYPDENTCLTEIFNNRYGKLKDCPSCKKATRFHRVSGRKCWACQFCSYQIHPLAGTIFHKSETPLKTWFLCMFLFSAAKNGVSAKEIQRITGVTYKTAWRIANRIRKLLKQDKTPLKNTVEIDETLMGGKMAGDFGGDNKTTVVGAVERGAQVRVKALPARYVSTVLPFVRQNVDIKATAVYTDQWQGYKRRLPKAGYNHSTVNHSQQEYARGMVHTNTIEGFWSQLKRGIDGSYHHVSPKYLQAYVDEFAYRYNLRFSQASVFPSMVQEAGKPV